MEDRAGSTFVKMVERTSIRWFFTGTSSRHLVSLTADASSDGLRRRNQHGSTVVKEAEAARAKPAQRSRRE